MARRMPEPDSPSLFDAAGPDGSGLVDDPARPLADRLRPRAQPVSQRAGRVVDEAGAVGAGGIEQRG